MPAAAPSTARPARRLRPGPKASRRSPPGRSGSGRCAASAPRFAHDFVLGIDPRNRLRGVKVYPNNSPSKETVMCLRRFALLALTTVAVAVPARAADPAVEVRVKSVDALLARAEYLGGLV